MGLLHGDSYDSMLSSYHLGMKSNKELLSLILVQKLMECVWLHLLWETLLFIGKRDNEAIYQFHTFY